MILLPGKSAVSRFPSAALMLMMVPVTLLFSSCDKLLPTSGAKWVPPEQREVQTPDGQFRTARLEIIDGKNAEAAARLRKLDAKNDIPQPMHNWITLYAGLAEMLSGREAEARPLFAKLVERGPFSTEGGNQKLASFFLDVGKNLSGEEVIPEKVSANYDRMTYEALALFLYAQKDENLGETDESLALYRQFTTSELKGPEPFVGLKTHLLHCRQYANNVLEYEDRVDSAHRALVGKNKSSTPEQGKKTVAGAKEIRSRIKGNSKLLASLDSKLKTLQEELSDQVRVYSEGEEADAKAFPEAKKKWAALTEQYQFIEAKQAILAPKLTGEQAKKEQEIIATKTGYLENFKFYLVQELRVSGYSQPITLKDGTTAPGGIANIDDKTIHVKGKDAVTPVPWAEVSPESIFTVAKSLVTSDEAPDAQGFRKWHLGNFAAFIGKTSEARTLLTEAVKLNPSYEPDLPPLLESLPN
ncbi:hypothetical protein ACXR0O_24480 [Verrucomicrobiota bacterium sgz303538]